MLYYVFIEKPKSYAVQVLEEMPARRLSGARGASGVHYLGGNTYISVYFVFVVIEYESVASRVFWLFLQPEPNPSCSSEPHNNI